MSIYLSLEAQEKWFFAQKFQIVLSTASSLLSFYCLINKTPPHQATIRRYFISIQLILLCADVFIDALCQPIALFPAPAGYCVGVLCRAGMTMKTATVIIMFLLTNIGFFVLSCCLHRHQAILPAGNTFKMSERTLLVTRSSVFFFFSTLTLFYLLTPAPNTEHLLDSYKPDITWIRGRGGAYYFQEITNAVKIVFYAGILLLLIAASTVISLFAHMFYILHSETHKRSRSSVIAVRKSLAILFAQLVVPLTLVFVPIFTVLLALLSPGLFPFEFLSLMCFVITLHPIGHNILLLSLTPAYRKFIISLVFCDCLRKHHRSTVFQVTGTK